MRPKHWIVFILLGLIWSTSFLWIKLEDILPDHDQMETAVLMESAMSN